MDESEAVAPIIWLYQIVDAQKEEVFFPDLLINLRRHVNVPKPGQNEPNAPSIGPFLAQFCHVYRAVVGGFSAQMALYAEMALMVFPHHVCF